MFKFVTLLVLVIALVAGTFAQEARAPVAGAPAPSAPRRAGPPSPAPAPAAAASDAVSLFFLFFPKNSTALSCFTHLQLKGGRKKGRREVASKLCRWQLLISAGKKKLDAQGAAGKELFPTSLPRLPLPRVQFNLQSPYTS